MTSMVADAWEMGLTTSYGGELRSSFSRMADDDYDYFSDDDIEEEESEESEEQETGEDFQYKNKDEEGAKEEALTESSKDKAAEELLMCKMFSEYADAEKLCIEQKDGQVFLVKDNYLWSSSAVTRTHRYYPSFIQYEMSKNKTVLCKFFSDYFEAENFCLELKSGRVSQVNDGFIWKSSLLEPPAVSDSEDIPF